MAETLTRDHVEVITERVPKMRGDAWLVRIRDDHYIISAVDLSGLVLAFDSIIGTGYRTSETMAFPANAEGEVTDWLELAFVPHKDHWGCIDDLLDELNGKAGAS